MLSQMLHAPIRVLVLSASWRLSTHTHTARPVRRHTHTHTHTGVFFTANHVLVQKLLELDPHQQVRAASVARGALVGRVRAGSAGGRHREPDRYLDHRGAQEDETVTNFFLLNLAASDVCVAALNAG